MDIAGREVVQFGKGATARYVLVRELTLAQLRVWLAHAGANPETDWLAACLLDEGDVADLVHFSDLTPAGAESYTPSELAYLWARVKAVNAHFFALLGRLSARRAPPSSNSPSSKEAWRS